MSHSYFTDQALEQLLLDHKADDNAGTIKAQPNSHVQETFISQNTSKSA